MSVHSATLDDMRAYSLVVDGPGFKLGEGFRLGEFASRDGCDEVLVHPWLIAGLVRVKQHFGGAIVRVNSGFRTVRHNKAVGGRQPGQNRSLGSTHLYGLAADIDVLGVRPKLVADFAENEGFGGVGRYPTFTHLDVWGQGRRWKG